MSTTDDTQEEQPFDFSKAIHVCGTCGSENFDLNPIGCGIICLDCNTFDKGGWVFVMPPMPVVEVSDSEIEN